MTASPSNRFGSGKSVKRVEDDALLRGEGRFSDNMPVAGQLYACFVRSPHPHASITGIDTKAAAAMPGVAKILTGRDLVRAGVKPIPNSADFRRADGKPTAAPLHHALAVDTVRFTGEAVAAVIAATSLQARDAAEKVEVDYEPLPAVVDTATAIAPGAPTVAPEAPDNIACEMRHGDSTACAAAFRRAAHVVALDLVNQRVAPCPIEPRSTLATYDAGTGHLTLLVSCQTPTGLRDELCDAVLNIPKGQVRVVVGDVGGGFGMKTSLYPEDIVVAFAARELQQPVRFTAERMEEFLAASHGRDVSSKAELALDGDGRILALRVASLANVGAYATPAGVVIQLLIGPWVSTSVYDITTIDIGIKAVLTHTLPTGPYRGAGRPEAIYIIERLMDAAARQVGIDRVELRRRNMIRPEQMPYTNAMDKTYDSGQFAKVMDAALALADWKGFDARAAEAKCRGRLRGQGMATFLEWTGADVFAISNTATASSASPAPTEPSACSIWRNGRPTKRIVLQSTSSVGAPSWPNGCHICEVEVDPDTGAVQLDGYWSVNDVGRVINPTVVIGQLEGGAAQGIGQALCERFVYDIESGQALTASFLDYAIPHAAMIRHFEMTMDESTPCLTNRLGVKGVGELGAIGATPAVVNAVIDALARNGFGPQALTLQMPLDAERVWRAMRR